ncbi:MAG: 50S ribosomal protein L6 [Ignavibacteriales bacterium]|nr:50S ribosomal protein L6 [Ignavibacteriales bacterium]MBK7265586.1 50S ribosomal protein L6 [Ignavibacteriales bacterium]MBK8661470.1 50S ribosomal protein L6 [Ignavibacteriales bacterium]MBP7542029.1 50S ribosomal protein L6 [Ignavibacteriaceae bacterium]MBP9121528.1 50S ribosomal protein L6 [Ignavibacteriaceae bacterium]
MSRIGKKPVEIPAEVTVTLDGNTVTVKGPKGQLTRSFRDAVEIKHENDTLVVTRKDDQKESRALHGLSRSLLQNMVTGVSTGYSKTLDIVGVGYKVEARDENLLLSLGYSHPIYFMPPDNIKLQVNTPTQIVISGFDKEAVGLVAAKIRSLKKPEPYKGKGIKYSDETLRRKAGKTAGKK